MKNSAALSSGAVSLPIKEARKLMPETTSNMADDEVTHLINNLELLVEAFIDAVRNDNQYRVNIAYNRGQKLE